MPLITCEMRWLLEGTLPAEVEDWFQRGGEVAVERWREDRYLVLPEVIDMGIKEREGRLEIKGRLAELGTHLVATGIEGSAERWCKWSFSGDLAERFSVRDRQAVIVGKQRKQRHFLLAAGGSTQETVRHDLTRRRFSIEVTRIRAAECDCWSLGIEAAPDDPTLLVDLLRALRDVMQGFPLPLPQARSRSYPRWLSDLTSRSTPLRSADRSGDAGEPGSR